MRGLFISYGHTAGVGVQALPLGKVGDAGCSLFQRLPGVVDEAGLLDEVVHAQRLEKRAVPLVGRVWFGPAK